MDQRKLEGIKRDIKGCRRGQVKARDLEGIAKRLGRRRAKRGDEPTYISEHFKNLRPVSIPHHGGRDIPIGTKNSILNQLEEDAAAWEELLVQLEGEEQDGETEQDDNGEQK